MSTGFFKVPSPKNEPINSYASNTPQRTALQAKLTEMRNQVIDVPMYIGAEEVRTDKKLPLTCPHDHQHILGHYNEGDATHVNQAIKTALAAREAWANMPWENRITIFLKAAELSATKYRMDLNASTMLGQSKKCLSSRNRCRL